MTRQPDDRPDRIDRGPPSLALRLVTAVVSVGLVVVTAEAALRIFVAPPPRVRVETRPVQATKTPSDPEPPVTLEIARFPEAGLYLETPSGLRLRPDTRAVLTSERLSGKTIEIRTNSLGHRGPEIASSDAGTRILFLGDSITLANYLPEEETFVHLVGELGAQRGHDWIPINAGVGPISLGSELAILEETGLSISPDVVVLAFYLNDFLESPGVFVPEPPRWLAWSRLARHAAWALGRAGDRSGDDEARLLEAIERDLAERLDPGPGDWRETTQAFEHLVLRARRDWGGAWAPSAWDAMRPLLEELGRLSREHDFRLAFVAFPVRPQVEAHFVADWPQRQLAEIAETLDVPFLDLLPVHRAARDRGELFYDHCHHTPTGSRVVAEAIVEFLETEVGRGREGPAYP